MKYHCNGRYVLYIDMVVTAVCETTVQPSVRTVYRYAGYSSLLNSSANFGTFCVWCVQLCVKHQCKCRHILYTDMVGTAVCETAVQLSVRTLYRYRGYSSG
jgi:hypothetical protein